MRTRCPIFSVLVLACAGCGGLTTPSPPGNMPSPDMTLPTVTIAISQNAQSPAPCVPADVRDAGRDCHVVDVTRDGDGAVIAMSPIPPCASSGTGTCWNVIASTPACPHGELHVSRSIPPPAATTAEAICALE